MQVVLSPEKRAFIEREIAGGAFKSEADAVERALRLYERHLLQIREAVATAEREIAGGLGVSLTADDHLARIRANAAQNR